MQILPARKGRALRPAAGQALKVINIHGRQVADPWPLADTALSDLMGMEHGRAFWGRLCPVAGDAVLTNRWPRNLRLEADTSAGRHDMFVAPRDAERCHLPGHAGHHDNCRDNLHAGRAGLGLAVTCAPSDLNLFMTIPRDAEGNRGRGVPQARPGDEVVLRGGMDCVVALSACPQDIPPINGGRPVEAGYRVAGPDDRG
jgi:hypothetical protein